MSCQQMSRLITKTATAPSTIPSATPEDPYAFTETVPATPPILFNAQKTRSKLIDCQLVPVSLANSEIGITKITPNQKTPLAQVNANVTTKFQAASVASQISSSISATDIAASLKNVTVTVKPQQFRQNKKITSVSAVRSQIQQSQQTKQNFKQLKSQTPPPLFQHTPSLWQTQLLLNPVPMACNPSSTHMTSIVSTSPAKASTAISIATKPTSAASSMSAAVVASPTTTLPPSKFHHTTLAQHLQKVQCIKQSKRTTTVSTKNVGNANPPDVRIGSTADTAENEVASPTPEVLITLPPKQIVHSLSSFPPPLQALVRSEHSDSNELNDIPVNVIFRKPPVRRASENIENNDCKGDENTGKVDTPKVKNVKVKSSLPAKLNNNHRVEAIVRPVTPLILEKIASDPTFKVTTFQKLQTASSETSRMVSQLSRTSPPPLLPSNPNAKGFTPNQTGLHSPMPIQISTSAHNSLSSTPTNTECVIPAVHTQISSAYAEQNLNSEVLDSSLRGNKSPIPSLKPLSGFPYTSETTNAYTSYSDYGSPRPPSSLTENESLKTETECSYDTDCSFSEMDRAASAVDNLSLPEVSDDDENTLCSSTVYCAQQYWLSPKKSRSPSVSLTERNSSIKREERIIDYKNHLRRQALQLLGTHALQQDALEMERSRLLGVEHVLQKCRTYGKIRPKIKKCSALSCNNEALQLSSYCTQHVTNDRMQQLFSQCVAKHADGTRCTISVFDVMLDIPLCEEHERDHDKYLSSDYEVQEPQNQDVISATQNESQSTKLLTEQLPLDAPVVQPQQILQCQKQSISVQTTPALQYKKKSVNTIRKRKLNSESPNSIERTQKHNKKKVTPTTTLTSTTAPGSPMKSYTASLSPLLSASSTSLESISSNPHTMNSPTIHQSNQALQQRPLLPNVSLAPPALAPLSGIGISANRTLNLNSTALPAIPTTNAGPTAAYATDLDAHEINQIVAQFAMVANNLNINNNNYNNSNYFGNTTNSNNLMYNNLNYLNTNSNSNLTSSGHCSSSTSLPSADELLTQDMLGICENSSAYASSEDTGLGGLSETELIVGTAPDPDEIQLADASLLEEHDLDNVLNALPVDAYNELFNTVHQDECDEVERALALADKHLKSLQQSIGSEADFCKLLNVGDEILAASDINKMAGQIISSETQSSNTSVLATSPVYIDGGSNSVGYGGDDAASGADVLVSSVHSQSVEKVSELVDSV